MVSTSYPFKAGRIGILGCSSLPFHTFTRVYAPILLKEIGSYGFLNFLLLPKILYKTEKSFQETKKNENSQFGRNRSKNIPGSLKRAYLR